jgi:ADP-heptose:LPS heptosyltransferase
MKILLVRLRLIGDVVFTTPAVTAIRDAFPDATITYLVEPAAAAVVQGHPGIDVVKVVPHVRGWRRIAADLALACAAPGPLRPRRRFHGGPRASLLTG